MAPVRFSNGYRLVYRPGHPRAQKSSGYEGYVYEHILLAEKFLGRSLREKEVVHHLDGNRKNNTKGNLLVLENSQHSKLHLWLQHGAPWEGASVKRSGQRWVSGICKVCGESTAKEERGFCSIKCAAEYNRKVPQVSLESLIEDIDSMNWVQIGKKYGVTDNAVRRWARKLCIELR